MCFGHDIPTNWHSIVRFQHHLCHIYALSIKPYFKQGTRVVALEHFLFVRNDSHRHIGLWVKTIFYRRLCTWRCVMKCGSITCKIGHLALHIMGIDGKINWFSTLGFTIETRGIGRLLRREWTRLAIRQPLITNANNIACYPING